MENELRKYRIGEKLRMNCGMVATIVEYRKYDDINVQFEDGTIVKNRTYAKFKNGSICHPNYTLNNRKKSEYLHMSKRMNCGMMVTIVKYRNAKDIDIQFEDGTIVEHKTVDNFKKGTIAHPNYKKCK